MAQCEYTRYDRKRCTETAQPGQPLCILHDKAADKDAAEFLRTLKDKVDKEESDSAFTEVNLAGVVFPPDFRWVDVSGTGHALAKPVSFGRATFGGDAAFGGATFSGAASFEGATFSGAASFRGATFSVAADFENAKFENWLRFQGTTFPRDEGPGVVTFTNVTLEKPERVFFQDVNLSRVSFLGTDLRQVRFLNTTWAKLSKRPRPSPRLWPFTTMRAVWRTRATWKRRWFLVLMTAVWRRRPAWLRKRPLNVLYDDPRVSGRGRPQEPAFHQAAELYRQLRVNLEENRQHIEAGDFYVGQMDMRLHDTRLAWRKLLWLYGRAVLYGESYWRPLALYGITALLFGLGYLWAGFQWSPRVVHRPVFDIAVVAGPAFWKDFGEAVVLALRAGPIPVSEPEAVSRWMLPLRYLNALLNVLWLALVVIALRRAFRR